MSDPVTDGDEAATLLTPEERADLLPSYITTREDLNAAEQENILAAVPWLERSGRRRDILTEDFLRELHRRMFNKVWRWAGKYRESDKNIGSPWREVPIRVHQLLDDAKAWLEYKSFDPDELAVRFHHQLVSIHLFPNGNGRHARLMADTLVRRLGRPPFSWGSGANLSTSSDSRAQYVSALRDADNHEIRALLAFARS
jgi:Fic-DOC domain mobile mystery protein B